jgi:hypothetical protein
MIITWKNRVERLRVQILLCPMHLKSTVVFQGSKTTPNCHYDKRVPSIDAKLLIRGNPRAWGKNVPHFPPHIVQETGLGSKPGLRGDRPATDRLRQGTAL